MLKVLKNVTVPLNTVKDTKQLVILWVYKSASGTFS